MKYLVIIAFVLIIGSLASALFFMMRGNNQNDLQGGVDNERKSANMVRPGAAGGVFNHPVSLHPDCVEAGLHPADRHPCGGLTRRAPPTCTDLDRAKQTRFSSIKKGTTLGAFLFG